MGSQFHLLLLIIFANLIFSNADEESSSESSKAAELFSTTAEIFEEEEAPIPERPKASCDVFDPFKVLPTEPGHYQIGGAFPLHREDCLELSPSSVQDVVAVQWAMAYWNEQKKPEKGEENADKKTRPKLGLFAGDSCARPKEAISQTLRFLDSIGFHEPSECLASGGMTPAASRRRNSVTPAPKLIGILAPKDRESAEAVAQSFQPTFLPIGVFSPAAAHAFLDAKVPGAFIATVPLIGDFIRTAFELVKMFDSDLVSIVDYGDNFVPTQKLSEQFRQNGISIAEVVAFDHSLMPSILAKSDSQIIISMVSHQILGEAEIGQIEEIRNMQKLWINLELEIDELGNNNEALKRVDFLESGEGEKGTSAKLQTITIRRQQKYLTDFNAYFLRVLVANYEHYSLLNSYVQNVYNCTQGLAKFTGNKRTKAICGREQLEPKRLAKLHKQSNSIESAINLVYAFAKAAEKIERDEGKREKCAIPNPSCFDLIRQEILKIGPNEQQNENGGRLPPGFGDQLNGMRFFETKEGAIQMAGIGIEAILAEKEGRDGGNLYKLVEYRTGMDEKGQPNGNVQKFQMPSKLRQIHSRCPQFRPYCLDKCKLASRRRDDQTFLSMPQQFSLYLAAMFDFQNGPNCDRLRRENPASVALPLAFVHSMSTFRQRNAPKSALFNAGEGGMDIGTILIDTCSSAQNLMEFLVDSERNCYKFSQVERNWTITSGATIGYLFGSEEIGSAQSGVLEAMFSNPTSAPIISIANEGNLDEREEREEDEKFGGIFPFGPSNSAMALALAKFLRQMHWTYVNVVLDKSDPTARSIFKQFQKVASGICIAELTIIGQEGRRQNGGRENEEQTKNKRASAIHKGNNGRAFGGGMAVTSANVTLVFSGAKQAAEYMSTWLRDEFMAAGTSTNVHVMLGDAHDFHLHDPTNLAQYAGTVSFQAKDVSSSEFQNWIRSITPLTLPEVWYWRHVEENWHCALSRSNIGRFHGRMCSGEELLDVNGMGRLAKAGYLERGIDKMLTAIDQIHLKHCGAERMCEEFVKNGRKWIREILWKIANEEEEDEFEIFQLIPMGSEGKIGYKMFANYSTPRQNKNQNNKIHLIADYRPFPSGIQTANSDELRPIISRCRQPFCKCPSANNNEFDLLDSPAGKASASYIRREPARKGADNSEEFLLVFENSDDPQVEELGGLVERELSDALRIIFLVLSALLCALAVATLLLILIKMYQRKIKGHQSLGILLLVGICGLYSAAFLFAIAPSADSICHLRIGLHALAHSLCFGVIIVKAIQLRNSEALALMGASAQQISYWNYWLLLMFIVAVQIVICMKWLLFEPFDWATNRMASKSPDSPPSDGRILLCSYSSANFVLSQIYTFLLLLLALLLSAQNRNIKRNYKEAKWLFITSLSCTLLLCAWAVCHILVNPLYLDHMTVLELHLTGSLLLAFIFGPKLYVLLFYEPILVECAYGGSENGGRGEKSADLFEGEWNQQNAFSPTLSNRSSKMNGPSEMGEEEEEKVTSAFQTILRKKMGGGSGSKISSENPSRTNSVESAKKLQCSNSKGGTPRIGPKGGMMRDLGRKGAHRPMSPQNV